MTEPEVLANRKYQGGRRAFTLIESLVVIFIFALLLAILLPSLNKAWREARTVVCRANLKALMVGIHTYAGFNAGFVVPSYNMRGVTGSTSNPFDGWGPILDQGKYVSGSDQMKNNPFVCPDTEDLRSVPFSRGRPQPGNAEGYMDWPAVVTISGSFARPIPRRGYDRIIRVAYWINGDNPTGLPKAFRQGSFFTGSVGYGPNLDGQIMKQNRFSDFKRPSQLIALADGFYAGKQQATRATDMDRRIGYRHHGRGVTANVAFTDGHVDAIEGDRFPRKYGPGVTLKEARSENLGGGPTLYSDPSRYLPAYQTPP